VNWCFLRLRSISSTAYSIFCGPFHLGHDSKRRPLIGFSYQHHQYWAEGRLFVHCRSCLDEQRPARHPRVTCRWRLTPGTTDPAEKYSSCNRGVLRPLTPPANHGPR